MNINNVREVEQKCVHFKCFVCCKNVVVNMVKRLIWELSWNDNIASVRQQKQLHIAGIVLSIHPFT